MVKLWLTVGPDLYSLYQVVHDESEDWQRALQSLDVNRGDCIFLIAELIVQTLYDHDFASIQNLIFQQDIFLVELEN